MLEYLKNRGITNDTIVKYKIGLFPKDLRKLFQHINPEDLKRHNIIYKADSSPFKWHPLVIPIRDADGRPIAIGCRTLLDEEKRKEMGIEKYRNSIYKKTSHFFGLDCAVSAIRERDRVFVVEGYFDAISAHQKGIYNVVATCGTLLAMRQISLMTRYTNNICLLFDNDNAGYSSAKKIIEKFSKNEISRGVNITCKFTPAGYKDIDEYIRKDGDLSLLDEWPEIFGFQRGPVWQQKDSPSLIPVTEKYLHIVL
jgi:DNA primase